MAKGHKYTPKAAMKYPVDPPPPYEEKQRGIPRADEGLRRRSNASWWSLRCVLSFLPLSLQPVESQISRMAMRRWRRDSFSFGRRSYQC